MLLGLLHSISVRSLGNAKEFAEGRGERKGFCILLDWGGALAAIRDDVGGFLAVVRDDVGGFFGDDGEDGRGFCNGQQNPRVLENLSLSLQTLLLEFGALAPKSLSLFLVCSEIELLLIP